MWTVAANFRQLGLRVRRKLAATLNLFITKSSEFRSFLVNGQTSKQYNRIGKHLLLINYIHLYSPVDRNISLHNIKKNNKPEKNTQNLN